MKRMLLRVASLLVPSLLAGCGVVLGLSDFEDGPGSTATTTSATGGSGQGGSGGSGEGGGGSGPCTKGDTRPCYTGPAGTQDVGVCVGGAQTCGADLAWGPCDGEKTPAMEDCSSPDDEDCDQVACSELVWAKEFGDTEPQLAESLAVAPDGTIVLGGAYVGSINFGPTAATTHVSTSATDMYLAKLDAKGDYIWSKSFGSAAGEADLLTKVAISSTGQIFMAGAYKVTIDLGGGPLTATGNQDFFVASFDKNGTHLWSHTFGLMSQALVNGIAATPDGDVVIVGMYQDDSIGFGATVHPTTGGRDAFVAKLAKADGAAKWSHAYTDATGYPAGDQEATALAVDISGNIVVVGDSDATIDFGLGFTDATNEGLHDAWVMRLGPSGDPTWHTYFHGPEDQLAATVTTNSTGDAYIAGWFWGSTVFDGTDFGTTKSTTGPTDNDLFLVKLSPQGKHAWTKQFGDAVPQADGALLGGFDFPLAVAVDSKENVVLGGGFKGSIKPGSVDLTSQGDLDWFLAKFAPDGAHIWSRASGDAASAQAIIGVGVDHQTDQILVHGTNDGSLQLSASTKLTTAGSIDVVAAKFQP